MPFFLSWGQPWSLALSAMGMWILDDHITTVEGRICLWPCFVSPSRNELTLLCGWVAVLRKWPQAVCLTKVCLVGLGLKKSGYLAMFFILMAALIINFYSLSRNNLYPLCRRGFRKVTSGSFSNPVKSSLHVKIVLAREVFAHLPLTMDLDYFSMCKCRRQECEFYWIFQQIN